MKNKNGFTLVELLAVIVVLVIILAVSIPSIIGVIESAKKGSAKSSAVGYIHAVEKYTLLQTINKTGTSLEGYYTLPSTELSTVSVTGIIPSSGTLEIDDKGNVSSATLCVNNYLIEYVLNKATVLGDCGILEKIPLIEVPTEEYAIKKEVTITYPENPGNYKYEYKIISGTTEEETIIGEWTEILNNSFTVTFTSNGSISARLYDGEKYIETSIQQINFIDALTPEVDLNGVPDTIYAGDSHVLPTSYTFGESGGKVVCKANEIEHINTATLSTGVNEVICTATSNAGLTKTVQKTVNVMAPAIAAESIIAGVRDLNYPNGNYQMIVNGVTYEIELVNINGNTTYNLATSTIVSLGNSTADQRMLIVKYNGDLTIETGVTVTASARKKGMLLYVTGTLTNNGVLTMTSRGANAVGQDVYLWKNTDNSHEYVPAIGGAGALAKTNAAGGSAGIAGTAGLMRQTGGGGSGGTYRGTSGAGAAGTSYSGGSGGAGYDRAYATSGGINGGVGGSTTRVGSTSAGGGAGNPGGTGHEQTTLSHGGASGTGGLLILYGDSLINKGTISSNGSNGGGSCNASGGSSGGGSINIFYKSSLTQGTTTANGGATITGNLGNGGSGGAGRITINQINW